MNKLYLNQYLVIVLSLVLLVLFLNTSYSTYLLFDYAVSLSKSGGVADPFKDPGFRIKFFEVIFYSVLYLTSSVYFALMAVMKFPIIEYGKEAKSKKSESEDSEEK